MAPKKQISPQKIILTAFRMIREMGEESITARKIAMQLQCSTMPIYSTIGSMHNLSQHAVRIGYAWLENLRQTVDLGCPLLDFEISLYLLAQHERFLWRIMYLKDSSFGKEIQYPEWRRTIATVEQELPPSPGYSQEKRLQQLQVMAYTVFGVGAAINLGTFGFYLDSPVAEQPDAMVDFFLRINRTFLPWYDHTATAPAGLPELLTRTLDTTVQDFTATYVHESPQQ